MVQLTGIHLTRRGGVDPTVQCGPQVLFSQHLVSLKYSNN